MPVGRWKQGNSREATHLPSCAGCNWAHTALAGWPAAKAAGFFLSSDKKKSQISFEAGLAPLELPCGSVAAQSAKHRSCGKHPSLSLDKKKSQISFEAGLAPLELPCGSVAAQSAKHRSCGKHPSLSLDKKKSQISFEAGLAPLEFPCGSVAVQSAKHRSCGKHSPLSLDKKKPDFIRGGKSGAMH